MSRKREILKKYTHLIGMIIYISGFFPKFFYERLMKFTRNHDNYFSMFIRYICLKNCAKFCGNNVAVFSNVYLINVNNLELGNNVSIHPLCYIDASGGIQIGDDVSIAHGSSILSEDHIFANLTQNIKDQGCELKKTVIENNVWIGAGCKILGGSYIESGSIIAAGAVVKNRVSANSIMGGIPAKLIRERESNETTFRT